MKKLILGLTFLTVSIFFITTASALVNILSNPGFEESAWPPAYWSFWQGSSGSSSDGVAGAIDITNTHSGSQSVLLQLYGRSDRWGGYSQDAAVVPGETVTASAWLMSKSSDNPLSRGASAYIELKFIDAANNDLAVYKSTLLGGASSWIERTIVQTAPANTSMARLSLVLTGSTRSAGKVYFDDTALLVNRVIDATPPVVTITSPADGSATEISPITVAGIVDDATVTSINVNGSMIPVTSGSWSSSVALIEGSNIITATATDDAGNSGSGSITIYYNPPAPGTNLLQNTGFENSGWPPAGWSEWAGASSGLPGDGAAGFLSTTYFYSGIQSAGRALYGSGIRWGGYSQDIVVSEGNLVTASGWLMSPSGNDPLANGAEAYIEVKFLDASNNAVASYKSMPLTGASSWTQHVISKATPSGTVKVRFSFVLLTETTNATGTVYFDDAVIEKTPITMPVVTITSPQDGYATEVSPVTVQGTLDDTSITSIEVNGKTEPVTSGNWSSSVNLERGANTVTAIATNSLGYAGSDSIIVNYNSPPVVTIISPPDASTVAAGIIPVVGTVDDISITSVAVNGNTVECYEGRWEFNLAVTQGANTITVTAVNALGKSGSDTATVTYDPTAAMGLFNIIYPADGAVVDGTPALITATLTNPQDLYININGREYLSVDGALIARVPISSGNNALELHCRNRAGNEETQYLNVTFDTSLTDMDGVIANSGFENSGYPQKDWFRWSGSESLLSQDGTTSFLSKTYAHTGTQSTAQTLFGNTIRWGGISQEFPVKPGDTVNASGYVASFSADNPLTSGASAWLEIKYISNRGNEIETYMSDAVTGATDQWVQLVVSSVAPAGTETAILSFAQKGPADSSGTAYCDDVHADVIDGGYTPPVKNPFNKPQSTGAVQVSGYTLLLNGSPFKIQGVCYQAVPIGSDPSTNNGYSDPNIYNRDLPLLRAMGVNTIRTYSEYTSPGFLDACYNGGVDPIYVIMGFYIDANNNFTDPVVREQIKANFQTYVNTYKNYPAVLMWSPGNEIELHYKNDDRPILTLINELAEVAYIEEGSTYHPVTYVLWGVPLIDDNGFFTTDADMDCLDAWGANVYEGISFTDLFDDAAHRSKKLFWVAEFGVDAWHTNNKRGDPSVGYLDEASQAQWDAALWDEIAVRGDVCTGGTVFEYSDEWWKDHSGADSSHGYVGYSIDYKMTDHPDEYSNEEWYGLFAVTDNGTGPDIVTARPVYYELKSRWAGSQQPEPAVHVQGITLSLTYSGPFVTANAVVTIYDESGQPASGATVSGVWSGLASDSDIGTTNSSGQVTLISNKARNAKSGQQFTFTVSDVALGGHIYDYAANVETSDSISIP